ncbi:MAG: anaerobic ribonucleoside-triphosphate reductase activating protein [Clostridia bacterium]|nr:anaerobic ribonucleoside-triphosphate reductase activating protein [Clostridia bacterium]
MNIQGIENVSFVDYKNKICATIFTGGCNFKCPYCHNSGIVLGEFKTIDENNILKDLEKRKNLIDAVTISGGEPTLQKDLFEFVIKIKNLGFLVKLDTNGTNPKVLEKLINNNLIDYVALDIKTNFDDYNIIAKSNFDINTIKKSLQILKEANIVYELRTTIVENFIKKENILKLAEDLKGENLLYLQKFVDSKNCFENGLCEVPKDKAVEYKNILSKTIKNVMLRGY